MLLSNELMSAMEVPLNLIQVEVVYAVPEQQMLIELTVPTNSTVRQAIEQSKILAHFPEIDLTRNKSSLDTQLRNGDSI